MHTFKDFCGWMQSQRRAAEILGVSEATVSRWKNKPEKIPRWAAERVEEISHGIFTKERVMWPDEKPEAA